jgi:hypothetical protein
MNSSKFGVCGSYPQALNIAIDELKQVHVLNVRVDSRDCPTILLPHPAS